MYFFQKLKLMINLKPATGPGNLSSSLNHKTNGWKLAAAPHWRLRPPADLYPLSAGKFRQQNVKIDLKGRKESGSPKTNFVANLLLYCVALLTLTEILLSDSMVDNLVIEYLTNTLSYIKKCTLLKKMENYFLKKIYFKRIVTNTEH